ncbi:uncharacterized protein LOC124150958 [Haliotis rufescens]|uniref:uncharacterized protein LOC124150958 n=1 Tax=Haliotis rufescens TaxID=6454 RepID=UPI00201E8F02|nr:uncharacterized protein LOC124150958 [Haliotis rufescens]
MTKILMLSVLVAIFFRACMCDPGGQNECTVVQLEETIEATTCGGTTTIRYTNGTLIQTQFFTNKTMTVTQEGEDTTSCYVQPLTPMPKEIDYAETTLTEFAEEVDADAVAAIQALVPECQGRTIYALVAATEDPSTGRRKRTCDWRRKCVEVYSRDEGWNTYCRMVQVCRATLNVVDK